MSHEDRSMWEDPDESPAVRQLLRAGRSGVSDYDVERGLALHLANVQAGAPLPVWAGLAAQKGAASSLLAWLLPPIIGAGVLGAWLWMRPSDPNAIVANIPAAGESPRLELSAPAAQREPMLAAPATVALGHGHGHGLGLGTDAPRAPVIVGARAPSGVATRSALTPVARPSSRVGLARASANIGRRERAHMRRDADDAHSGDNTGAPVEFANTSYVVPAVSNVAVATRAEPVAAQAEAARPAQEVARPAAQAQDDAPAKPAARGVSDSRLEREMQMLAVAQRVLVDDPARSLRLTRQGEQEFRGSMFSAERKQVSLLALVQLGRTDEARRSGQPFLRAYPNAPWSARLREALRTGRLPAP